MKSKAFPAAWDGWWAAEVSSLCDEASWWVCAGCHPSLPCVCQWPVRPSCETACECSIVICLTTEEALGSVRAFHGFGSARCWVPLSRMWLLLCASTWFLNTYLPLTPPTVSSAAYMLDSSVLQMRLMTSTTKMQNWCVHSSRLCPASLLFSGYPALWSFFHWKQANTSQRSLYPDLCYLLSVLLQPPECVCLSLEGTHWPARPGSVPWHCWPIVGARLNG